MESPDSNDLVIVGRIIKAHGIRGELKVLPETDDPEQFLNFDSVLVGENPAKTIRLTVDNLRFQPSSKGISLIISFTEIKTRDDAETLAKTFLYVDEEELELDDDEFFIHDLIGCQVLDKGGDEVGIVKDVLEMPAHFIYLVERSGKSDVMIPAVDAFIEEIDLEGSRIVINTIDGLLDA